MSLTEIITFDKEGRVERFSWIRRPFLALVIILISALSFGIGRLTGTGEREPVRIEYDPLISNSQFLISNQASISNALNTIENSKLKIENSSHVYASSKGKKYYYAHCGGVKRISEANLITFPSASAAEASGYGLAANCKVQ